MQSLAIELRSGDVVAIMSDGGFGGIQGSESRIARESSSGEASFNLYGFAPVNSS